MPCCRGKEVLCKLTLHLALEAGPSCLPRCPPCHVLAQHPHQGLELGGGLSQQTFSLLMLKNHLKLFRGVCVCKRESQ